MLGHRGIQDKPLVFKPSTKEQALAATVYQLPPSILHGRQENMISQRGL